MMRGKLVVAAAVAGLVASAGDFLITIVLGFFYPNYHHLQMVMSELGTPDSPVAAWIGAWWVIFGVLFLTFAAGLVVAFGSSRRSALIAALLVGLFGLGAGVGAGLFPMDPAGSPATPAGELHDAFAGVGFLALAFVPLVSLATFPRRQSSGMFWLSLGVFMLGVVFLALFIVSEDMPSTEGVLSYVGLWQRLFLLVHYSYLGVLTGRMIRSAHPSQGSEGSHA